MKKQIKLICFDFDGVFNECTFCMSSDGIHYKSYNGKDSYGLKILKDNGYKTGVITASNSECYEYLLKVNHFNKLDYFIKGCHKKLSVLEKWKDELGLEWSEVCYMGDDTADIPCLKKVGLAACPNDAIPEVIEVCNFVAKKKGGQGAVRELINFILK